MLIGFFPLTNVAKSDSSMFLTIVLWWNIINKTSFFYLNQFLNTLFQATYHLNNYFRLHVCLSIRQFVRVSHFQISFRLMSRGQVRPLLSEAKPSYVYSILKPHGQSSKSQVRLLLSEAKPSCVYSILKPHGQSSKY